MKRLLILIPLLLLPLWIGAQTQENRRREARKSTGAALVLLSAEHDFGTVDRRGGDLHYTLHYRNEGSGPLVLTRIITSCSCLKCHFSKRPLPVGGQDSILLIYEPLKAEPGTFNKVVQILSNSTSGRELFTIHGNSIDYKRRHE